MLVPFIIDVDSLNQDPSWNRATFFECHENLLDVWSRAGILIHDGERYDLSRLRQVVEKLPQKLRMQWKATLERYPPIPTPEWDGDVRHDQLTALSKNVSLALVDDTVAESEFQFNEEEDEREDQLENNSAVVVCRLQRVRRAKIFQLSLNDALWNIKEGDTYDEIWKQRFRSMASAPSEIFKRVTIVDRYAVAGHIKNLDQHVLSGLERFIRLLDKDAGDKRYITLYSAWTQDLDGWNAQRVKGEMEQLLDKLPRGMVRQMEIHVVPNRCFTETLKDRYVRFTHHVWELGHGLEVFQGQTAAFTSFAHFKSDTSIHRKVEQALRSREPMKVQRKP